MTKIDSTAKVIAGHFGSNLADTLRNGYVSDFDLDKAGQIYVAALTQSQQDNWGTIGGVQHWDANLMAAQALYQMVKQQHDWQKQYDPSRTQKENLEDMKKGRAGVAAFGNNNNASWANNNASLGNNVGWTPNNNSGYRPGFDPPFAVPGGYSYAQPYGQYPQQQAGGKVATIANVAAVSALGLSIWASVRQQGRGLYI